MIVVRPLAAHEWPLLKMARIRSLQDAPRQFGMTEAEALALSDDDWRAMVAEGEDGERHHVVVATSGTDPVGLAIIERDQGERRKHRARIWAVWVHPDVRGRGVGRRLMTALLEWAKARDVVSVYLDVPVGNDPARSLYERLGFVRRDLDPYSLLIDGEFVAQERLVLVLRPPGRGR